MSFVLRPWQLYLAVLAGWVQRQQQEAIEYLRTENRVLLEKLGRKRILLNHDQRRRLAVKAKVLGRKRLAEVGTLFTPDTLLRWHRQLVAKKWDYSARRRKVGRPALTDEVKSLVLQMARENPTWGYDRIAGAMQNLSYPLCDESVRRILQAHGIEPAPHRRRQTTWKTFLRAHWDVLASIDFTTVEVWTKGGLVTFYLLLVMELKTRRVHFAGATTTPDAAWMKQVAKNFTDCQDGFLRGKRYLLMDRDAKFCQTFRRILDDEGVKSVQLPPRSPNLNAHLERFFGSLKSECLGQLILFGEGSLRRAVREFLSHYHTERNHQGLGNRLIETSPSVGDRDGPIQCRQRLGGMLRHYHRRAA